MPLDPKRHFSKKRNSSTMSAFQRYPVVEDIIIEEVKTASHRSITSNQDKIEAQNLEKLKKSLRELILEKEGGSVKKLKTFALK